MRRWSVPGALAGLIVGLALVCSALGGAARVQAAGSTGGAAECPTVTGGQTTIAAILAVPELHRATCFGSRELTIRAWGWTVNNTWPGINVAEELGPDFIISEHQDMIQEYLDVFLPPTVALPAAQDSPWRDYGGIPPGFAWFRITGHFNDPAAKRCTPSEGDIVDDVPVVVTDAQAVAFCRNHFTIATLTWEPDHAGARTAEPWVGPDATATIPGSEPEPAPSAAASPSASPAASASASASPASSPSPSSAATPVASPAPGTGNSDPAGAIGSLPDLVAIGIVAVAVWLFVRRRRR